MELYNLQQLKKYLATICAEPKKSLSQHFLINQQSLNSLIQEANIQPNDYILEIGPGPGVLTEALLNQKAHVIAIEKDKKMVLHLKKRFTNDSITIINQDFLKTKISEIIPPDKKIKVVANIPYSITTNILKTLLPCHKSIQSVHFIIQKEVAQKCTAPIGTSYFGILTLFTSYYSKSRLIDIVPKESFYPMPNIDSAIIEFILKKPSLPISHTYLFDMIHYVFQKKRKTLKRSLSHYFNTEHITQALKDLNLSDKSRPQELSIHHFSQLLLILNKNNHCNSASNHQT